MRSFSKSIFGLALLLCTAAGCGDFLPIAACGTCEDLTKSHPGTTAGCCGRGCVLTDTKCASGWRYVGGSGKTLVACAEVSECYYPEASAGVEDMSQSD